MRAYQSGGEILFLRVILELNKTHLPARGCYRSQKEFCLLLVKAIIEKLGPDYAFDPGSLENIFSKFKNKIYSMFNDKSQKITLALVKYVSNYKSFYEFAAHAQNIPEAKRAEIMNFFGFICQDKPNQQKPAEEKKNLEDNYFFVKLNKNMKEKIPHIKCKDRTLQMAARNVLTIKFQTFHDNILAFVRDENSFKVKDVEEFKTLINELFSRSIEEYEIKISTLEAEKNFMDQLNTMFHNKDTIIEFEWVNETQSNIHFSSNEDRFLAFTYQIGIFLDLSLMHAEKLLEEV